MGFFSDIGDFLFGGDDESKGFERAQGILERVEVPELRSLILDLGELVEVGQLTPRMADAILQETTGFEDIQTDPRLQQEQYRSLQRFREIADSEGLDPQTLSRLRQVRQEEDARLRGDIGAIEQAEARRGELTSSGDFVNQLIAAQSSANRFADQGFDEAALAQQRSDTANIRAADLAGNMEQTSFGRQAEVARAQDAINQFNVRQRQNVEDANTERLNRSQEYNLNREMQQDLFNIGQRDREEASRVGAIESDYTRRYGQAQDRANLRTGRGTAQSDEEGRRRDNVTGFVQDAGDAIMDIGASVFSDREVKENIFPIDLDEFLSEIEGYEYNYKGDDPENRQYGVMSDDLDNTEYGASLVDDSGEFDKVNYNKAVPGMMAAIADIHKRLKRMED